MGGGTGLRCSAPHRRCISIHPPCGGRDRLDSGNLCREIWISIHPPCGGRDVRVDMARQPCSAISIHPPWGGRDRLWEFRQTCHKINFNPPALWGAGRHAFKIPVIISNNFNPPALWGAGLVPSSLLSPISVISIHPPCGGRDSRIAQLILISIVHSAQASRQLSASFHNFSPEKPVGPGVFRVFPPNSPCEAPTDSLLASTSHGFYDFLLTHVIVQCVHVAHTARCCYMGGAGRCGHRPLRRGATWG